ncbi:MAG: amidohydrolase [Gemmatimonadaceae bacterium]|nr:amidohydrolase [Gemmatimonadaceae bacterium]
MIRRLVVLVVAVCAVAAATALVARPRDAQPPRADLVFINGHVVTVDSQRPEAQAVAVRGDRIVAVGTTDAIRRLAGPGTRTIDLGGRLLIPGFIEGHGHYLGLGESKLVLDLTTARNWDDIVAMVGAAAREARAGEWIVGRGWHQEKWDRVPQPNVEGVPLHASLDRVSADHPVLLTHASGHAAFANARALQLAGVTRDTPNPDGGEFVKDAAGEPTGFLKETAQRIVGAARTRDDRLSPADRAARFRRVVQLAGEEALRQGVTTFHDAGADFATIDAYRQLADEGKLPVRLYVMVRRESNARMDSLLPRYRLLGYGNHYLTVRSIKRQIDGALGPRGAWLLEPYADLPTSSGLALESPADIEETARVAIKHGFQVNTHAIGDRANREVLDIYERTFRANPDKRDLRWRDEHSQHIDPADIARFRTLGVIASMQGIHTISDGPWVPRRLGEERARRTSYLWRALWDAGVIVTNGTDVPVEKIDPIPSFWGSVSRIVADGSVFLPEQRVTRAQGLQAYTLNNAYAAFEERDKGSITVGKLADLAVLTKDIMTIPEREIPTARVAMTVLGGKVVYEAK